MTHTNRFVLSILAAVLFVGSSARAQEKAVTNEEVASTVNGHMADIKDCLKDKGVSSGKTVVNFTIEPDGHVSMSKVEHSSANKGLDACVASAFKTWKFPKPRDGHQFLKLYPLVWSVPKEKPKGTLTEAQVLSIYNGKLVERTACLTEAKKEKADVAGTLELGVVVSDEGGVTDVTTLSSNTGSAKLDKCIIDHVKKWQFPDPDGGGEAAIKLPFKFAAAADDKKK